VDSQGAIFVADNMNHCGRWLLETGLSRRWRATQRKIQALRVGKVRLAASTIHVGWHWTRTAAPSSQNNNCIRKVTTAGASDDDG
jgi:hypothetical protein